MAAFIKGCVCYIFYSFFFFRSNFSILDIQISWRHQMPEHKTRNTFYKITCPVYVILQKEKIYQKTLQKLWPEN